MSGVPGPSHPVGGVLDRIADQGLPRRLLASALAGASSGCRSFTGLGALVVATRTDAATQSDKLLAHPVTKTLIGLAGSQELVMDKLPGTPNRTTLLGLCTRVAGAAGSGLIIARRRPEDEELTAEVAELGDRPIESLSDEDRRSAIISAVACAGVAIAAATLTAVLGVRFRSWATRGRVTGWLSAGAEDAVAVGLAAAAVRLTR